MCSDFSENSNIYSLFGPDFARQRYLRLHGDGRLVDGARARGNRLFTIARDCVSEIPSK
jgi:hypothetical protein